MPVRESVRDASHSLADVLDPAAAFAYNGCPAEGPSTFDAPHVKLSNSSSPHLLTYS